MPYRIALVALLVVSALWFTVLRPKPPADPPATTNAPGVTGLGNDVSAAKGAVSAADSSAAAGQAAANSAGTATTPSASGTATAPSATTPSATTGTGATAATPKAATATDASDPSTPLLRALDGDRAVVLMFSDGRSADDRAVRDAVGRVSTRGGRVVVKVASVRDVGRYQAITRGVQINETPTVLVINAAHTARAITGLTSTGELDQAAGDALHAASKR
jgi:cytoskeletal protein RodZ